MTGVNDILAMPCLLGTIIAFYNRIMEDLQSNGIQCTGMIGLEDQASIFLV